MKRKVVKHGPSTLIVSLPVKWAREHGISPGDELEVEESGKELIVSTESTREPEKIEIDVSGMDRTSIILQIRDLYRKGYCEIRVNFRENKAHHFRTDEDVSILSIIHIEVNRLIGMEIIEQKGNFCIIKEITESSGKEFHSLLRKVFFQLNGAFEDIILALEKENFSELSVIEEKHDTVTKFISYCLHLLSQGKTEKTEDRLQLYQLLISAELIIDILKYFSRDVISVGHRFKKTNIKVIRDILELVEVYSRLQFKFKKELMLDFQMKRDIIKKHLIRLMSKKENLDDMVFINYLTPILEVTRSMSEIAMSLITPIPERGNVSQQLLGGVPDG